MATAGRSEHMGTVFVVTVCNQHEERVVATTHATAALAADAAWHWTGDYNPIVVMVEDSGSYKLRAVHLTGHEQFRVDTPMVLAEECSNPLRKDIDAAIAVALEHVSRIEALETLRWGLRKAVEFKPLRTDR